jgi:hypothetical protein
LLPFLILLPPALSPRKVIGGDGRGWKRQVKYVERIGKESKKGSEIGSVSSREAGNEMKRDV